MHLVYDSVACLLELEPGSSDEQIIAAAQHVMEPQMAAPTIVRPTDAFYQATYNGVAVEGPFYLAPEGMDPGDIAVFLDLRNICQNNTVVIFYSKATLRRMTWAMCWEFICLP